MSSVVSPTRKPVTRITIRELGKLIRPEDRIVLGALFAILFWRDFGPSIFAGFTSLFAGSEFVGSRTLGGAEILGFVAIALIIKDLKTDRVLGRWEVLAAAGVAIAVLCFSHTIAAIGLTCLGLLFVTRSDKRIASLGQLCIGLAWIGFWGALVLFVIKPWLLPIETALAFAPLSLFGSFSLEGIVISNTSGHAIEVLEPCSAFHNTIVTAFIWLSIIKILGLGLRLKHFYILAIALGFVVVLNTARIGVMAISENQYLFWHVGPGLLIVKVVMLGAVFGLFYFGLDRVPRRGVTAATP
jgi:hypothetical protein